MVLSQRRSRHLASCLLIAVLCLNPAGEAWAQRARTTAARAYAFNFVDADIASVANEILGETLRLNYSIDPAVSGRITFRIERRLTAEQLLSAFETVLATSGVVLVRQGSDVLLVPKAKARAETSVGAGGVAGYQVVAVPLRFATPSEIAKVLSAAGAGDLVVHADDKLGLLVLSGSSAEIRRARETIAVFDRNGLADARLRFVTLKTASAESVSSDLDRLLKAASLSGVSVVTLKQLNSIVILARSEALLNQIEGWALRLDQPSVEETTTLWVYRPRNVAADALAEALRSLTQSSSTNSLASASASPSAFVAAQASSEDGQAAPEVPISGTSVSQPPAAFDPEGLRVSVEKSTNSLLVMAPASRWRSIKGALAELDRAPDQVLIEATVLEVTLNKDFRLGVDWSLMSANGKVSATQSAFESGAVTSVYPGLSITYLNGGVRAVVDALSSVTDVEVVSAPKLVALDNQNASLQVGDEVPVVVQRAQGTSAPGAPLVVTTEYRDTGVILRIKPRINGDHSVLLDLSQEVSGVARTTTSGIDSPTIQQRKFASLLEVREGQTIALGGLISSTRSTDEVGIPLLRSIPAVGNLFKTSRDGGRRTELIVLLNAKILRAAEPVSGPVDEMKGSMKEIGRRGLYERQ